MESIALTYAKALFLLSEEEKTSAEILEETSTIKDIILSNNDFIKMFNNKIISKNDKKNSIDKIFKNKINHSLLNFIKLLIDKSRINDLEKICNEYRKIYMQEYGIKEAKIYSASKLAVAKLDEIKESLETKYQTKFIVENIIDEKLLAGVKIVIGDLVIDGSISNKLDRMKANITI